VAPWFFTSTHALVLATLPQLTLLMSSSFNLGLAYFEDWFQYDPLADDEEKHGCHSAVGCFWLIFYAGVPIGNMAEVVDNTRYEMKV